MALSKLVLKPGINRDQTNYASEGGWYECDKIRFRSGFPEKIGGWQKDSEEQFVGVCRSLFNWVATDGSNLLGIATNKKVYIEAGQTLFDITPTRALFIVPSVPAAMSGAVGSVTVSADSSYTAAGSAGTGAVGTVTVVTI